MISECERKVQAMAELMAGLFYCMADTVTEKFGEPGEMAVKEAITRFGKLRLEGMYDEARRQGLPLDSVETYTTVRDMPSDSWQADPETGDITFCPMQDLWKKQPRPELGYLYCAIDHVLIEGFGGKLERPLCLAKGDACCQFIVKE